jgi:hypothetical protein
VWIDPAPFADEVRSSGPSMFEAETLDEAMSWLGVGWSRSSGLAATGPSS